MRRKHDWPALVQAHARSGLTQRAFCQERGLSPVAFCQNRRKMIEQGLASDGGGEPADAFVRARRSSRDVAACRVELSLGVMTLRFPSDTSPAYVAALVEALA